METLVKPIKHNVTKLRKDKNVSNNDIFDDWKAVNTSEEEKMRLLVQHTAIIKVRLLGNEVLSRMDKVALINLLGKFNDEKEKRWEAEYWSKQNITPAQIEQQNSEAAWRLHKKFQSGREIKA